MPDYGVAVSRQAARVMQAVAELAEGGLQESMRIDAGVRLLVTARRMAAIALPRHGGPTAAEATVLRVMRGWDPSLTTAAEYLETLPLAELDAFLAAGPVWAAEQQGAVHGRPAPQGIRRAA
jgi:pyridoxine 5'-phosphate synthase PdxJ